MALNILEMLTDALGDEMVNQASQYLGESKAGTQAGLSMILPALLGGLANKASTADGAGSLLDMLRGSNVDSGMLGNLAGLFSGGTRTESLVGLGTSLVKGLLGEKGAALAGTVASLTGLKSSSSSNLLYMAAPLIFGFLKKLVGEQNLDASGLMRLLAGQLGFLRGAVDERVAGVLGLGSLLDTQAPRPAETPRTAGRTALQAVDEEAPSSLRKVLPFLLAIAAALTAFMAIRSCKPDGQPVAVAPAPVVAPVPTPAPVPVTPTPAPAPVVAALPAKVYFAVGSAVLDDAAKKTIAQVAAAVNPQGRAVDLTGYTDQTGNVAANKELAKRRAQAIQGALTAAGVAAAKINMKPPLTITGTTTGSGSDAEARRVEISLAK
jgi:outer membrane protein OmpA-like peptidoglycan-associated protein